MLIKRNLIIKVDISMKVLFFSHDSVFYGAPQALYELVKKLAHEYSIDCIVITPKYGMLNTKLDEIEIVNYSIKYFWNIKNPNDSIYKNLAKKIRNYFVSKSTIYKLSKKIDIKLIDLVHTNTSVIDIGAKFSKKYEIPHIWHVRESIEDHFGLKYLRRNNYTYIRNNSKFVITISKSIRKKYFIDEDCEKTVKLIYDGIDKDLFPHKNYNNKNINSMDCVFVGKIYKQKGQLQVVKAISILPEYIKKKITIDFYGDYEGKYYNEIQTFIDKNNLQANFRFLGYSENVNEVLSRYDIGFVCSKSEGFGRTTVEYMLSEVCPIVSDTGANIEIVKDGYNGLVYKYDDINCLVEKIIFCYENKNKVKQMTEQSRVTALSNYTLDSHVENIVNLFREAIIK
jgi:glycosyltransferase involved in cell wall biosynthesis